MSEQFEAGDEVYCPQKDLLIYKLDEQRNSYYPVRINGFATFQENGKSTEHNSTQAIFHATPQNKALLDALYGVEFESPKLKGSNLTRQLLGEGKHVLCYVSDESEDDCQISSVYRMAIIIELFGYVFLTSRGKSYRYAVPCNEYTNLPDGALTPKSEQ